ncbi:MAG: type II secretion system F family protein [Ruminiclostridium sp.]
MINVILLMLGIAVALFWSMLFLSNYKGFAHIIASVDDNDYFLKDIFVVGLGFIKTFKVNYMKIGKRNRNKLAELYSKKYADFNVLVCLSAQISYILTFIPIGCFIGVAANEPVLAALFVFIGVFLAIFVDMKIKTRVDERHDALLMALPNVLSKMALLVNVGTTFREAWKVSAAGTEGLLGAEMRATTQLIDNGMAERDAYVDFADRCKIQQIKKMVAIICQNLEKGSSELASALKEISIEAWSEKKNIVKRLGENANNKLVIPMMIMFAGVIMMVMVPIMANMNLSM